MSTTTTTTMPRDIGTNCLPVMSKLMRGDQVGLSCDDSLSVVVPAAAEPAVKVQGVAVLEVLRGANTTHAVPPGRSNIGKTENSSLKLDVCEQMRETKVLVGGFPAKHLLQS